MILILCTRYKRKCDKVVGVSMTAFLTANMKEYAER